MSKKRIILIEDERDLADLVAARLKREGYAVELYPDGQSGLDHIRSNPPDLVLLDIMLPGLSGTEVLSRLRNDPRTATLPVVLLTAKSEESDIVVGLRFGADDYVTKPFSMSVLAARIETLLRRLGAAPVSGKSVIRLGPLLIDPERHQVEINQEPLTLTLTEFRLLTALAAARGRVLNRNQLMDQAMGLDCVATDRTIDVHITALRRKLGPLRAWVQTIRGVGYKLDPDTVDV